MSPRAPAAFILVLALVLTGCGDPLDARYGVTTPGSINGCAVFHEVLKGRTNLRDAEVIGPRLEQDGELLVHLARYERLPDAEACAWLEKWLRDRPQRQAVLILQGGTLTSWLCRRWADQARAEAKAGGAGAIALEALADQLERRAEAEEDVKTPTGEETCPLFTVKRHAPLVPQAIAGLELERLPQAMRLTGSFQVGDWPEPRKKATEPKTGKKPTEKKSTHRSGSSTHGDEHESTPTNAVVDPLITLSATGPGDGGPGTLEGSTKQVAWAITISYGDSRLVVVLDALPLLDGAQPDPAARRLLTALIDHLTDFHDEPPHTTWVRHLRVRGEGGPPNPMLAVLTSAPVSYISWHFVVFLVALALAGAAWLGRREAPAETRHDRFSRHVLALAGRLREGRHAAWCARAIARAALRHRQPPPALLDEKEASRWLASLTETPNAATPSPRGSHAQPDSSDA